MTCKRVLANSFDLNASDKNLGFPLGDGSGPKGPFTVLPLRVKRAGRHRHNSIPGNALPSTGSDVRKRHEQSGTPL